jgi:hypothetical protein
MGNPRTRECVALFKDDCYAVACDSVMVAQGWQGGQGVMWTPSPNGLPTVTLSNGYYAGFALWGSNEASDQHTAQTGQFLAYRYVVIGSGGWIIMTQAYEHYTWASRTGGGPLVPITYNAGDRLLFSLRGLWSIEDEWSLSADSRAPNNYFIGSVVQAPRAANNLFMTIQTGI